MATSIKLEQPEAEQMRALTRQLAAAANVTVTQAAALAVAVAYALDHVPDVAQRLAAASRASAGDHR